MPPLADGIAYKKCDKTFGICNWALVWGCKLLIYFFKIIKVVHGKNETYILKEKYKGTGVHISKD